MGRNGSSRDIQSPLFAKVEWQFGLARKTLHCAGVGARTGSVESSSCVDGRVGFQIGLKSFECHDGVSFRGGLTIVADESDCEVEFLARIDVFLVGAEDVDCECGEVRRCEDGFGFLFEARRAFCFGKEVFVLDSRSVGEHGSLVFDEELSTR